MMLEPWSDKNLFCHDLPSKPFAGIGKILVTGASGYIGGRLIPELSARGYQVRAMVRKASPEQSCLWPESEIAVADALDQASLRRALAGIDTAYYLIHSMHLGPKEFAGTDLQSAVNFREAAQACGVKRIIYLGGLGDINFPLSRHLLNRMEVAEELKRGTVPVTVLRSAVVIGSGSAPYEIIKHLAAKLPCIVVPRWGRRKCQPIGVRDVIKYLVGVLEIARTAGMSFDIGGRDVLSYQEMMGLLVKILQRRKHEIFLPFQGIRICSYIASLITPVPAPLIRCLFESLKVDVVCQNQTIKEYLPFEPLSYEEMIVRAMSREDQDKVYTRWTDAYPPAHILALNLRELPHPPRYTVIYSIHTERSAAALYKSFCHIGGKEGWFSKNWLWWLRGTIDRMLLGAGSIRGRRSATTLKTNDVIDFWRVEDLQPDRRLLLRAEMKLPGRAWLEFNTQATIHRKNILSVIAYFDTNSLFGKLYWYMCLPLHHFIFSRLLTQIEKRS